MVTAMEPAFDPSGFDGVWRMYLPDSKVRDPKSGEWVPEVINDQVAEMSHDGDVMHFRCRIDHAADLHLYLEYTCRYGADEWVPYTVAHIEGDPDHPSLQPNNFRKVYARVGEPIAFVREIYMDPRTQFRLTRHPDGSAQYGLMSRLSEDRQRVVGTVQSVESDAAIVKHMVRETGPAPDWP
jgi:hypothetical protein